MPKAMTRPESPAVSLRAVPTRPTDEPAVHVGQLSVLGEERLARLLALRPDLAAPAPGSLAELVERSLSLRSVYRALMGADVLVLQLAQVLTIIGEKHAALDDLYEMVGEVPEADVQRGLSWLEDRHLICRLPGSLVCVHVGLLSIGGAGALGPPAADLVGALSVNELKPILQAVGRKSRATRKAALAAEVLAFVTDQDAVRAVVGQAPAEVREYTHRVAAGSTSIELPWDGGRSKSATALAAMWLLGRGLAYKNSWHTAVMPREVGLALRGGRPFPAHSYQRPQIGVQDVSVPDPTAVEERVTTAVQAVERIIDVWGSKPAALLKSDGIGVREVRRLAAAIEMPERETFRLIEIAAAAGLVVADTRRGLALPTSAGDEWLDLAASDRWWVLAASWLETAMYPSLTGVVDPRDKAIPALGYPATYESEAARQRRVILGAVLDLPGGTCASDGALVEAVVWDGPMLWNDAPGSPSVMVTWTLAEMELLGLMVGGAPTPLASALMSGDLPAVRGLLEDPSAGAWQMVLQADLTAVLTGRVPSPVRAELELLADVEGRGSATLYRFSEGSVRRAFDAGRSSEEILDFLEEHATKGLPQPLAYLVKDVERRHGQVRLGRAGCYIRFEDPALATEVVRNTRTAKLALRQIAPTVLVCDQSNDAVLKALRAAGHLPVIESIDGSVVHAQPNRHRAEIRPGAGAASFGSSATRWEGTAVASVHRWRSQLTDGGADTGWGSSSERELALTLLGGARSGPSAERTSQNHRLPGSRSETSVEIPTMLRRPSGDFDRLVRNQSIGADTSAERRSALRTGLDRELDDDIDLDTDLDTDLGIDLDTDLGIDLDIDDDAESQRPTEIFHSRDQIVDLLTMAEEEEWLVRLSYTSAAGKSSEVTVLILGISGSVLLVQVAPRWTDQKYVVERISWARALTEAEEEMVW